MTAESAINYINAIKVFVESMPPGDLIAYISATGTLITGVGTIALAWFGNQYVQNKVFEHKFNLAKEAINIFNHLRNDLKQIRSPFGYEGEINRLKNLEDKNDLIKRMKKHPDAGLTLLRMDDRAESLAQLNRLEPEFKAIFIDTEAFGLMRGARKKIYNAANALVQDSGNQNHYDVIWSLKPDDEINELIDAAVNKIEKICYPTLQGKK